MTLKKKKGSKFIIDYIQSIKVFTDELPSHSKPIDHEDIIDWVPDDLNSNYYIFINQINCRDSTINFEELHEKLITKELAH